MDDDRITIAEQDSTAEQPASQNDASGDVSASPASSVASTNGHMAADELPSAPSQPAPAEDEPLDELDQQPAPAEDEPLDEPDQLAAAVAPQESAAAASSFASGGGTAPLNARRPEPVPEGIEWYEAPTVVIAPTEPTAMQPLPLGAVLADKYVLRGTLSHDEEQNVYRAASIAGDELYTIVESAQQYARGNQQVISQGLSHPHLLPVIDLFSYQPYGDSPRYYAVSPAAETSLLLSDLDVPLSIEQTFGWAKELAEVLDYLHEQGVYSPLLTPDNVMIENNHALIGDLSAVQVVADADGEQETLRRHDVAQLAQTIAYAISGSRNATPATLPLLRGADDQSLPDPIQLALGTALSGEQGSARAFYADLFAAWRTLTAAPTDLLLHSGKLSHIGMLRRNNQDSLAAMECVMMVQSLSGACGVYVVADGMGGHKAGEVASAIAVNVVIANLLGSTIAPLYSDESADEIIAEQTVRSRIVAAIQEANQRVNGMRMREGNDMGTTIVAALVMDGRLYVGNVGDSRAYLYRPATNLRQLTADHSLVARLIELGQINELEAAVHPHRHVIFRSLGEKQEVEVDTFVEPLQAGDRVLLCSDGLSGMVSDSDMAAVLASEPDPQAAAQRLVELANAHGGVDNISVIVVNVEQAVMGGLSAVV
jgi:serine/threonine protein phosphatase PrpC